MDAPEGTSFVVQDLRHLFKWTEYTVFTVVLGLSLGIGIFFGCCGKGMKTKEDFLMGGRSMSILPVTSSLICTFVSAITLLGHPVEIYLYGQQHTMMALCFIPVTFTLMYLFVPVFFHLKLTSAYEYFEWRYSRFVRSVCSLFAVLQMICYLPIQALGPTLAMDKTAGFPWQISSACMFVVCIIYSSLGGLKGVLWTDVLQGVVMAITVVAIATCGLIEAGGFSTVWHRSSLTGRLWIWDVNPDPRARYTVWTSLIGGYFLEMILFGATQSQIQRYNSVRSFREAKWCMFYNMIGLMFVNVICSFMGMILFSHYWLCDPVTTGAASPSDQMLPLFVLDVLREYPLVPGLLLAGIACGSLSSMSNALTSLATVLTEDFVRHWKPDMNDEKLAFISKCISTLVGIIGFSLVFLIKGVNETINLSPLSTLFIGSLLGPILGAFTLGLLVPFSNNRGITIALILSAVISTAIGTGNILAGRAGKLPDMKYPLSTAQCPLRNLTTGEIFTPDISNIPESQLFNLNHKNEWKDEEYSWDVQLWSLSFMWQPAVGTISMLILGSIFSLLVAIFDPKSVRLVHHSLISPPMLRFWESCCGGKKGMARWIDYSEEQNFRTNNNQKYVPSNGNGSVSKTLGDESEIHKEAHEMGKYNGNSI